MIFVAVFISKKDTPWYGVAFLLATLLGCNHSVSIDVWRGPSRWGGWQCWLACLPVLLLFLYKLGYRVTGDIKRILFSEFYFIVAFFRQQLCYSDNLLPQWPSRRVGYRWNEYVYCMNSDARILAGVFLKVNVVMVTRTVGMEKMKSLVVSII